MNKEQIYVIGEQFMLNELGDVINITYPKNENLPAYFIADLENGIKLKVSIVKKKTKDKTFKI